MSKFILTVILILSAYSFGYALSDSNSIWNTFKAHNSILGFSLGTNTVEEIIEKMGGDLPDKPDDKHELANVCFKVYEKPLYIIFSTGVLHDYSTLYGFQISKDIPDNLKSRCRQYKLAKNENLTTNGGLHIGQRKDDVLKLLSNPSQKASQKWTWSYENYLRYVTPKTSSSEAGPTDSRYLMTIISIGEYEYGSITVKFLNEEIVDYAVEYSAESDFYVEHHEIKSGERIR